MAPPTSLPFTDPLGGLFGPTLGQSLGGNSLPTTASTGTYPLTQSSLPGTTATRPVPAASSTPTTLTDAARPASQTSQAARQSKAPLSSSSTAHMSQTQTANGFPSTPTATSLPSASTSTSSNSSHLLAPILGVICALGAVAVATASFVKYNRRRRNGARKIREGQRAISFINQLSQYEKPSADDKSYGGAAIASPASLAPMYTKDTNSSKLPTYHPDDYPATTFSQYDHPLSDHYQVAQLTYANETYHGQNGQLEMRMSPTGTRFIPPGSWVAADQVTDFESHPGGNHASSVITPPITSPIVASVHPQELSHGAPYIPQSSATPLASNGGLTGELSNGLLGPASYDNCWPQTPSFSSSNAGISPVLFATRQPDGLAYFSPGQSQSQGNQVEDGNESQSHGEDDSGRSRSDTQNSRDTSSSEGESHTLEYHDGVEEPGVQENDWPTSVCHQALTSEGDEEEQRTPQADSPDHGTPRLSQLPHTSAHLSSSQTSTLGKEAATVRDGSTGDNSIQSLERMGRR